LIDLYKFPLTSKIPYLFFLKHDLLDKIII
jgi:hypothetical protein